MGARVVVRSVVTGLAMLVAVAVGAGSASAVAHGTPAVAGQDGFAVKLVMSHIHDRTAPPTTAPAPEP